MLTFRRQDHVCKISCQLCLPDLGRVSKARGLEGKDGGTDGYYNILEGRVGEGETVDNIFFFKIPKLYTKGQIIIFLEVGRGVGQFSGAFLSLS